MGIVGQDEQTILNLAYNISEQDNNYWDPASVEYNTARGLLNVGVQRWEMYESTDWPELYVRLADAADGGKIILANTYTYACPSDFVRDIGYVRTYSGTNVPQLWKVISPNEMAAYVNRPDWVCYFTGTKAVGYTLHLNPTAAINTGDTIDYEYYKQASRTTTTTSKVDMSNPNFLSYFVAAHMADGGLNQTFFQIAEELLDEMQTAAESGEYLVPNLIDDALDSTKGFGQ